ncbi:Protein stn1 [Tolypocladium ophioglossoides CBS 100239]|uniref:Protein stn1 n=1 Tax=Tolypocladium ophioglossoides (strain CBS 100239) TaxID=1163406 RepID=A0A0L0NA80_TOLOC|nr:Protein stn1 [Tolypocladium ophioglossoides CBS 100239]
MRDASRPELYPRHCFHLSPTLNAWCLLRASEIHDLDQHAGFEGEDFFFYKNLPIKWVRIVGVVVEINDYLNEKSESGRRVYIVDDSSGACIEALVSIPTALYQEIDLGSVVDVKGALSTFRDEKQIKIEKMAGLKSTTQELALWEKRAKFRRDVLDKPWVLRNRDIRRCRKEAEGSEADAERKRKRLKTIAEGVGPKARPHKKQTAAKDKNKTRGDVAVDIKDMIRDGAMKGKYNALGL